MKIWKGLRVTVGALLFAALMRSVLAAPGFLSDRESTVGIVQIQQARR